MASKILDQETTVEMVEQLLSTREKHVEEFLHMFFDSLEKENKFAGMSADLAQQSRFDEAFKKVSELSLVLSHRLESVIKFVLNQREQNTLKGLYGNIQASGPSQEESSEAYQKCFNTFVDCLDAVSIKAGDPLLIGDLCPREAFILTFFAFITMKRSKGDNLMQLIICGKSSTGD
jgi:midasin (ATPase involved in ribosome maturation)